MACATLVEFLSYKSYALSKLDCDLSEYFAILSSRKLQAQHFNNISFQGP